MATPLVELTITGPPMVPGHVTHRSPPGGTVTCALPGPETVTCAAVVVEGLRTWTSSPAMPGLARSNHVKRLVVEAEAAGIAWTSLKVPSNWTRFVATTAGPLVTVTVTGPPMVPSGQPA